MTRMMRRKRKRLARVGAPGGGALTRTRGWPRSASCATGWACALPGCGGRPGEAAGPRVRGRSVAGLASAQLAGEDFLAGLDRQRADAAGQQLTPVPGLAPATARR